MSTTPILVTDIEDETNTSTFGQNLIVEEKPIAIEPIVSIEPIPALPSVIIPKIHEVAHYGNIGAVKPKFPLDLVPFHEKLEITSVFRIKSWAQRLTMSTRRLYIHYRKANNKFYWDMRNKDDSRNSTLFGPFDTQTDAYTNMSSHYNWGGNVIERVE